jgi:hypothetical protein
MLLVFVWLAHDRRFVGAVLILFVLFIFIFIFIRMISGRHRVAHDHEGIPVDQPGGKVLGDEWGHVVAPSKAKHHRSNRAVLAAASASISQSWRLVNSLGFGLCEDITFSTGRWHAADNARLRFGTGRILGFAVGGL